MRNAVKLHQELADAGLPVVSVRETGEPVADYARELSQAEQAAAAAVIAAHNPGSLRADRRMIAGDGVDQAMIDITAQADAVDLTINGESLHVPLVDGAARLPLVSSTPDTDLVISGLGMTVRIYVR